MHYARPLTWPQSLRDFNPTLSSKSESRDSPSVAKMWPFSSTCGSPARLSGKTAIITGANSGIGKETARDLYYRGARVILACRNVEKANEAVQDIRKKRPSKPNRSQFQGTPGELVVCKLDLCSFTSVRECARQLLMTESRIDLLINNAGVMMCPREITEDGNELQLQSNHLGHFLLTLLLLPKIRESAPGCRVVNVSSLAHTLGSMHLDDLNLEKSYNPIKSYQRSKLANVLFTKELARKLNEAGIVGITTYALHPGVIATELGRHLDKGFFPGVQFGFRLMSFFIKTPELGAQTTIYCAVDQCTGKETGLYYSECSVTQSSAASRKVEDAKRLWNESLKIVGLPVKENLAELLDLISQDFLPSK